MFSKIEVKGSGAHPLFTYLCDALPQGESKDIQWNFEKFIVNKEGSPVARYLSKVEVSELEGKIKELLS